MKTMRIALLVGLACACLIGTPRKSNADIWPAAVGDSLRLDFNCLDSLGKPIACDSAWFTLYRGTTSGNFVVVDSGSATAFGTGTAIGTNGKARLLPGRDSVYMISVVGNTTVGHYKLNVKAYGGTMGAASVKLTAEFSRWFVVGAATTTNYAALSDVQRWNTAAVAVPTVAGVPEVDATHWAGQQAATVRTSGTPLVDVDLWKGDNARRSMGLAGADTMLHVWGHASDGTALRGILGDASGNVDLNWGNINNQGATNAFTGTQVHVYDSDTMGQVAKLGTWAPIEDGNDSLIIDISALANRAKIGDTIQRNASIYVPASDSVIVDGSAFAALTGIMDTVHFKNGINQILFGRLDAGTAQAVAANSITLRASASAEDSVFNRAYVTIISATTGTHQTKSIATYNGTTKVATLFSVWPVTPTGTITYVVWRGYAGITDADLYPNTIGASEIADGAAQEIASRAADSVWGSLFADRDNVAGSFGDSAQGWGQTGAGASISNAEMGAIADSVWKKKQNAYDAATNTFGLFLDTTISSRSSSAGASGAGAWLCSLLVIDSAAGTPVQGITTWITTSGAFTAGQLVTNSAGNVVFNLDNGTHAAHIFSAGVRLATNADTVINISGANFKDTISVVSTAPAAPAIAGLTRVYGNIRDIGQDSNIVGIEVWATTVKSNLRCCDADTTNFWVAGKFTKQATFVTSGCWQIDLVPSASWNPDASYKFVIKVPGVGEFTKVVDVPSSPAVWRLQWAW